MTAEKMMELEDLADEIEESDGIVLMLTGGTKQIGIRRTTLIISTLRSSAVGAGAREALENCLGCVTAAESEGLHEVINELRGFSEQTDRLIDLIERRLLYVRHYAEPVLASLQSEPAQPADKLGRTDREGGFNAARMHAPEDFYRSEPVQPASATIEKELSDLYALGNDTKNQHYKVISMKIHDAVFKIRAMIAQSVQPAGKGGRVCCYCDAPLSCGACGVEQPDDTVRPEAPAGVNAVAELGAALASDLDKYWSGTTGPSLTCLMLDWRRKYKALALPDPVRRTTQRAGEK